MPEWMADLTLGGTVATTTGILIVTGLIWKVWKPIKRITAAITAFMDGWNGTPEVEDASGAVIKPAVPGVLAQLGVIGVLRQQLENSHQDSETPNLRDDLDTKASTEDVAAVASSVEEVLRKLDEHISIAKESDRRQELTEAALNHYLPHLRQIAGEE